MRSVGKLYLMPVMYADKKAKQAKVEVGGDQRRRRMALIVRAAHCQRFFPKSEKPRTSKINSSVR